MGFLDNAHRELMKGTTKSATARKWANAWVEVCELIHNNQAAFRKPASPNVHLLDQLRRILPRGGTPTPQKRRIRMRGAPAVERNRDITEMVLNDGVPRAEVARRLGLTVDYIRKIINKTTAHNSARKCQK